MANVKPFLSISDQIVHLTEFHGLVIDDYDQAAEILSQVNYYRLINGYSVGLMQRNDHDRYIDGISLSHLYRLYYFDSQFRNLLLFVIEQIEIQFRTRIAYYHGGKYGPLGYMDVANFNDQLRNGDSIHESIISHFNEECKRQSKSPMVHHHYEKYDGQFPVWVAVELITFGNLTSLFSIMSSEDRTAISRLYGTDSKHLKSWMLSLVEIRNICAHYGRLYNMPLKQSPYLFREHKYLLENSHSKVFPSIIALNYIFKSDERWHKFFVALKFLLQSYSDVVNLSFIGFPNEWEIILGSMYK